MSEGTPDSHWFEELANSNETLFYILRVKPDVAFEYVNDAVESLIGWTAAEAMADAGAVLGVVDEGSPPGSPRRWSCRRTPRRPSN